MEQEALNPVLGKPSFGVGFIMLVLRQEVQHILIEFLETRDAAGGIFSLEHKMPLRVLLSTSTTFHVRQPFLKTRERMGEKGFPIVLYQKKIQTRTIILQKNSTS